MRVILEPDRAFLRGRATRALELGGDEHPGPMPTLGTYPEVVEKTGREAPGVHN